MAGVDQLAAGLRHALTSPSPEIEYKRLAAIGIPFSKGNLFGEIQHLFELRRPDFPPLEVWSDFYVRRSSLFGRTTFEHQAELVTTLPARARDIFAGDGGMMSHDVLLFANGAILSAPTYRHPQSNEARKDQRFPCYRLYRPERRSANNGDWKSGPSGIAAIRSEFDRLVQQARPGSLSVDVPDSSLRNALGSPTFLSAILDLWQSGQKSG